MLCTIHMTMSEWTQLPAQQTLVRVSALATQFSLRERSQV